MTNPVIDCLLKHRSVRKFKRQPVSEETILSLITAGTRAATAGNLQMYSFLIVDDRDQISRLEGHVIPEATKPPLVIIALLDLHRIRRWLEINDSQEPILDRPVYFMLGFWDATIALQNIVVAAESLGLGTCYYGSMLEFDIQRHFGTPKYVFPAGLICLGYPDEDPPLRQRLPVDAVIHKNRYQRFDVVASGSFYRERDAVWSTVREERKQLLREQGIGSIPQALAVQRFSDEPTRRRSEGILRNLRNAGFTFQDPR
jgi:nitroreductase